MTYGKDKFTGIDTYPGFWKRSLSLNKLAECPAGYVVHAYDVYKKQQAHFQRYNRSDGRGGGKSSIDRKDDK